MFNLTLGGFAPRRHKSDLGGSKTLRPWGVMAGVGVYLKLRVTKTEMVSVWFYATTAALPLFAGPRLLQYAGDSFVWILAGFSCYLLGVVFLLNDTRVRYFHSVWHVLVILGSICHYFVISDIATRAS
ncbi:MAG: hypothetical protein GY826_10210 [Fuerstiella sp.]|nr:hypothetical protein [Fuerstiella sp.]